VLLAGVAAVVVFLVEAGPQLDEWSVGAIAMGGAFALVLAGFVLLAGGKYGPQVTSRETDTVIAESYTRLRRKLRPLGVAIALGLLAYVAYAAWRLWGNA